MDIVGWHQRFFGTTTGRGDAVAERERELGLRFPRELRALLVGADCAVAYQVSLYPLALVDVFDGRLVIAPHGDAAWWGVRVDELHEDDPVVELGTAPGTWQRTAARLGEFLRFAVASDRVSSVPCVLMLSTPEGFSPPKGWEPLRFGDRELFTRGSAVLNAAWPGFLGARTKDELLAAIDTLPVDPNEAPIEEHAPEAPPRPTERPWRRLPPARG